MNMILNFKKARKKEREAFATGRIIGEQYAYARIVGLLYSELKEVRRRHKEAETAHKRAVQAAILTEINVLLMKVKDIHEQRDK